MAKKIVEVGVKVDNEGGYCYVIGEKHVSFGCQYHSWLDAKESLSDCYMRLSEKSVVRLGLTTAPTIHTYEVEVDDE